ncbi:hypothetical protein NDU88_005352 [Pleurodeles waltl]|uniref:Uncharacterized protein n=1 Tax=Pleurodeles waltl TaxID=8319 RepID=A0AAV7TWW2_PLEWA|nr:hypothetical protein NDU88_005352 [Pleurodeles waltl]
MTGRRPDAPGRLQFKIRPALSLLLLCLRSPLLRLRSLSPPLDVQGGKQVSSNAAGDDNDATDSNGENSDDDNIFLIDEEGNSDAGDEVIINSTTLDVNFYFDVNETHGINQGDDFFIFISTVVDEPIDG